jgi:hypothetical protein
MRAQDQAYALVVVGASAPNHQITGRGARLKHGQRLRRWPQKAAPYSPFNVTLERTCGTLSLDTLVCSFGEEMVQQENSQIFSQESCCQANGFQRRSDVRMSGPP